MNKKLLLLALVFSLVFFSACNKKVIVDDMQDKRIKVAATIFPLADIIENIGGDKVEVVLIVEAWESPHTFEAAPSDILHVEESEIVFAIGYGLDNWVLKLFDFDEKEVFVVGEAIELKSLKFHDGDDEHDELSGGEDPHYWTSIENAKIIAGEVYGKLSGLDPDNADFYMNNWENYLRDLDELEVEIREKFSSLESRNLLLMHESFNYFADEFDLNVVGVFESVPGKEPNPKHVKELYDLVDEYDLKAIFAEPQLFTELITPIVDDKDLKIFVLDPLGGGAGRNSYIENMRYNANEIYEALK